MNSIGDELLGRVNFLSLRCVLAQRVKTYPKDCRKAAGMVYALLLFSNCGYLIAQGIPEPPLIFYGTIRNTAVHNFRQTSGKLSWQIRKPVTGRTISISAIVGNFPGFSYVLEVPAETVVVGAVSTGALDLTATAVTFEHFDVRLDGSPVFFALPSQLNFSASSRSRGRIERVDLTVSIPCDDVDGNSLCDEWELRYFGTIGVDPDADDDGDGMKNRSEFETGSDPGDIRSAFQFISYEALPSGAIQVQWDSADGRLYRLWRGTNVTSIISASLPSVAGLSLVQSNVVATPPVNTLIDASATPPGPYFYRLELER